MMAGLLAAIACGYAWVRFSPAFTLWLHQIAPDEYAGAALQYGQAVFAGLLIVALALLAQFFKLTEGRRGGDGLWNSGPGRWMVGAAARATLYGVLALGGGLAALPILRVQPLASGAIALGAWAALRPAKIALGRVTRPLRRFFGGRHVGLGGSARFSGLLDEWANPWRPGQILLGASLYDPRWLVGMDDDRHVATIATSRAGKGRSAIIPNLLSWPGSALVIDPKGQNACVTALKRGPGGEGLADCLGQTVRILDPLGEIVDPCLRPLVARFNPLGALDVTAVDYCERVDLISDALVVQTSSKDSFFDHSARALISGLIDFVLISKSVGREERNLATVRGLLIHPDGPPLDEMAELGGLAQAGAAGVLQAGKNAAGDVISTAITHTKWLDSVGMQHTLGASDFNLGDLNDGKTTVYLVLPPQYIDVHRRFLRLFVNLALQAVAEGRKRRHATLFLLDEFYSLGCLQQLEKSAGVMAGYGVKLWTIIQNIGQLQELYPRNWETFLGNAGQWTVFAVNDQTTARYVSDRLGKRILWRKMRGPQGFEWEISGVASLRDPQEFSQASSRESDKLVAFTSAGEAFFLRRTPYDRLFKPTHYMADPFEGGGA